MSFTDAEITLSIFAPDLLSPIATPRTAIVDQTVEFPDTADVDLPGDPFTVVNADLDVTPDRLVYVIDQSSGRFANVTSFNGYVIADESGTLPEIASVAIDPAFNTLEVPAAQVFFSDNAIYVDVDNLRYSRGDQLDLVVGFAPDTAPPEDREDAVFVARIYEATLGRNPDRGGLNFWIDERVGGLSKLGIAEAFIVSPEFEERFGGPGVLTDAGFVDRLYLNILGRDGDPGGRSFWTGELTEGRTTRDELVIAFADSAENIERYPDERVVQNLEDAAWDVLF